MKGKQRVPVPVAGPAFRGGVKFVKFYVFGSFLQPAAKIGPIQRAFPPVGDPSLRDKRGKKTSKVRKTGGKKRTPARLIIKMREKLQTVPKSNGS